MRREVVTVPAGASARDAALAMKAHGIGSVIVVEGTAPVGIVTERDVAYRVVAEGRDPDSTRAADIMSRPLASIAPSASVEEAATLMKRLGIKRLVVLAEGHVRGIVTATQIAYAEPDLARSLLQGASEPRWEG